MVWINATNSRANFAALKRKFHRVEKNSQSWAWMLKFWVLVMVITSFILYGISLNYVILVSLENSLSHFETALYAPYRDRCFETFSVLLNILLNTSYTSKIQKAVNKYDLFHVVINVVSIFGKIDFTLQNNFLFSFHLCCYCNFQVLTHILLIFYFLWVTVYLQVKPIQKLGKQ